MPSSAFRVIATLLIAAVCASAVLPAAAAQKKHHRAKAHTGKTARHPVAASTIGPSYAERDDALQFADDMAGRNGLDAAELRRTLAAAHQLPAVAKLMMPAPAGSAKNWAAYRARFVEPVRIRAGAAFWQVNQPWLTLAEERYGVPAAIVVGIVGVETIFGRQMGNFRVIDVLATLAFDFPAGRSDRSAFFRSELEQFLLLCQREHADPLTPRGSYAGAMGMPQFMPSSVNRHAVDFDGDGRIDLQDSAADVIGSVAHYLAEAGWQHGLKTHFEVAAPVDSADRAWLLVPDIVPSFSAVQFTERGARLAAETNGFDGKLALVELQNGAAAPSYLAGTANFYAITRYNWSSYYALAVIELGDAIREAVEQAVEKGVAGRPTLSIDEARSPR